VLRVLDVWLEIADSVSQLWPSASHWHTFASVTKQHNLVLQHKLGSKQAHRATVQHTGPRLQEGPVSMVLQLWLVSGRGSYNWRSLPPYGPSGSV